MDIVSVMGVRWLTLVTFLPVVAYCTWQLKIRHWLPWTAFSVFVFGALLNVLVMLLNGGMPVCTSGEITSVRHHAATAETVMLVLGDCLLVGLVLLESYRYLSIGDVLMFVGFVVFWVSLPGAIKRLEERPYPFSRIGYRRRRRR